MKKTIAMLLSIILLLMSGVTAVAAETIIKKENGGNLYPFRHNEKWGYMDKTGNVIIKPQFSEAEYFSEGLAAVRLFNEKHINDKELKFMGLWGFINADGEMIIPATYDSANGFNNGIAIVTLPSKLNKLDDYEPTDGYSRFYYINKQGKSIYNIDTTYAMQFSDDWIAPVTNPDKPSQWLLYNRHTKTYKNTEFYGISNFSQGLAVIHDKELRKGLINSTGKVVIWLDKLGENTYRSVGDLSDGLAIVDKAIWRNDYDYDIKYGAINSNGKLIIPLKFDFISPFHDGLAIMRLNGKCGLIDKNGNIVVTPKYDWIESYNNGLFMVCYTDGISYNRPFLYYCDLSGKIIKPKI